MFCEIFFDGARVPVTNRLGGEGEGWAPQADMVTASTPQPKNRFNCRSMDDNRNLWQKLVRRRVEDH